MRDCRSHFSASIASSERRVRTPLAERPKHIACALPLSSPNGSAMSAFSGRGLCLVIAGPTGSGKSALAVALARRIKACIINADSMQIYNSLRIVTARPSHALEKEIPHRLYGIAEMDESYSAARWCSAARAEIMEAHAKGVLPIIVGGSGLYIEALIRGLSPIPEINPAIRQQCRAMDTDTIRRMLEGRDPEFFASLTPADPQRMRRALEVLLSTGISLRRWQAQERTPSSQIEFRSILCLPERLVLYEFCTQRLHRMVRQGALREIAALPENFRQYPIGKALGVRELHEFLRGNCSRREALERAFAATRRYAKRQYCWFRHRLKADAICSQLPGGSSLSLVLRALNSSGLDLEAFRK